MARCYCRFRGCSSSPAAANPLPAATNPPLARRASVLRAFAFRSRPRLRHFAEDGVALAFAAAEDELAADRAGPKAHRPHPQAAAYRILGRRAAAVIEDLQPDAVLPRLQFDPDRGRPRVFEGVLHRFLRDTIQMIARLQIDVHQRLARGVKSDLGAAQRASLSQALEGRLQIAVGIGEGSEALDDQTGILNAVRGERSELIEIFGDGFALARGPIRERSDR